NVERPRLAPPRPAFRGLRGVRTRYVTTGKRTPAYPHAKTSVTGEFANLLFSKAGFEQWRSHVMLPGGLLAGTEFALIVHIYTVSDRIKTTSPAKILHDIE